jgi:polyhydroxybutyrate depolymerase
VMSSSQSAQYFAGISGLNIEPQKSEAAVADGISVERTLWQSEVPAEVELVAIKGGGHSVPQSAWRYPRILGPTAREPDGPQVIWDFFARQKPR